MSWKVRSALAASLALAVLSCCVGSARADEAEDAAKKVIAERTLRTTSVPAQWLGLYAGSVWTEALEFAPKDDGDNRLYVTERIESRDREKPKRVRDSWWIDSKGVFTKGERSFYEAGENKPKESMKFEVKDGKLEIRTGVKEDDEDLELTGAFVPDALLAVTTLPDSKGKSYRFTCLYQGKVAPFTIDDMGKEKVRGRSGEVEARKLVLKDQDGEVDYWVDDKHAVLVMKTVKLENLVAFAGTREESLADWTTRSDDEADVAADKLMTGPAGLAGLTGELRFGAYMENGGHEVYNLKLKSEEKDGKPAFHFTSVAAIDSSKITDDWWFSAEGAPLGGTCKHAGGETEETITGRIDGKNIATKSSESKEKDKEKVFPLPRRFSPDAIFLLRALRGEEKGTFRFGGFDLSNEIPLSVYFRIAGTEALKTAKGEVKAKHVHLEQNAAEAECWIDEAGSPLLVRWGDGDIYAAGPIVDPKDLPRPASEPEKKKDEDE